MRGFVNFECDVLGFEGVNGIVPGKLYVPGKLQVGGCLLFLIRNIVVFVSVNFRFLKYFWYEKPKFSFTLNRNCCLNIITYSDLLEIVVIVYITENKNKIDF